MKEFNLNIRVDMQNGAVSGSLNGGIPCNPNDDDNLKHFYELLRWLRNVFGSKYKNKELKSKILDILLKSGIKKRSDDV